MISWTSTGTVRDEQRSRVAARVDGDTRNQGTVMNNDNDCDLPLTDWRDETPRPVEDRTGDYTPEKTVVDYIVGLNYRPGSRT